MRIVFATNNRHKVAEVEAALGTKVLTPKELGIFEETEETEDTLEGNALLKARSLWAKVGGVVFSDDTGLEVEALGGAPGVYSARYAGEECNFEDNNRLLLNNLNGVGDRSARFRTVVALIVDGAEHLFEGRVDGRIIEEYRGEGGFGYDPVFVPTEGDGRTFAQMTLEEKNAISHRARAVKKLADFLKNM